MIPFHVDWTDDAVRVVLDRVRAYRFPPWPEEKAGPEEGWRYGCDGAFLRAFCAAWTDGYDWREAVRRLNRFEQFTTEVDGVALHFVHLVGEARGRRPLLLTHGWPGSHLEFWKVAGKLAFPSRHGGRAEDAFDLVIPSLPNFGFSARPERTIDPRRAAALLDGLMTRLGYGRYLAHGGDWGALVTSLLALHHAAHVRAIHLTMMFRRPEAAPRSAEEKQWAAAMQAIEQPMRGYSHLQGSKPQSLSWAVGDSPVGQAAWILERFHDWADLRERRFEEVFTSEELLDTVMVYVMTGAFHSSIRFYSAAMQTGVRALAAGQRVRVPTAFACFADPLHPWPPRSYAQTGFDVARWTVMPRGGHFPALEVPDLLVGELRAWAAGTG